MYHSGGGVGSGGGYACVVVGDPVLSLNFAVNLNCSRNIKKHWNKIFYTNTSFNPHKNLLNKWKIENENVKWKKEILCTNKVDMGRKSR